MNIFVKEVRIRNFRSLKEVNVTLEPLTLLVGANNSGKTSFLRALQIALGIGRRIVGKEDIFLSPDESLPRDRQAVIDLLVIPTDENSEQKDSFNDAWRDNFGLLI